MQTPEPLRPRQIRPQPPPAPRPTPFPRGAEGVWAIGERLSWIAGLVLAVSAFTGWYADSSAEGEGPTVAVTGWHTGILGKLVFFLGLGAVAIAALRAAGIVLPASVPESILVIAIGSLATIFVLIRVITIPDTFAFAGRGIGIWISLVAAAAVIVGGLLRANEEL